MFRTMDSWGLKDTELKPQILEALSGALNIKQFSKVQLESIPEFIRRKDVTVQAPTGSGKTLAYLVPIYECMMRVSATWEKHKIGALVVVPNRELCRQVYSIAKPIDAASGIRVCSFTGGRSIDLDVAEFVNEGGNVLVGTPGRLAQLMDNPTSLLCKGLKSLEILVFDEADRLTDMTFTTQLSTILSRLPKQRTTALFSATQCQSLEDTLKFGQRNLCRITVDSVDTLLCTNEFGSVTPQSLTNYYQIIPADEKMAHLIGFLRNHRNSKILVFASTCACVEYLTQIVTKLWKKNPPPLVSLHGKKRMKREKVLDRYRALPNGIMISTDVMARGIDVADIDWVIQLDPPRQSSWFVHRAGRAGRQGRLGCCLLFVLPSETGYVDFLTKHERVQMVPYPQPIKTPEQEKLREKLVKLSSTDRDQLLRGTRAYVSYIQSYAKHDCHMLCPMKDLDVVGVAHDYGLLRLPKMPELCNRDLSTFQRVDINTADIEFADKTREIARKEHVKTRREETAKRKEQRQQRYEQSQSQERPNQSKGRKRRRAIQRTDIDDIDDDYKLIRKLKRGKISKTEFDDQFE